MSYLATFAVALASALIPFINIEVYLVGAAAAIHPEIWSMSAVAAAGQMLGKVIIFLAARGVVSGRLVKFRRVDGQTPGRWQRWADAIGAHRWGAMGVVAVSAFVGIPPLFLVSVLAGSTQMHPGAFAAVGFVGRWARFGILLAAPGFLVG